MSEKTLLAEIRDLYSSNNCEDVIEKSIGKIYKILKRSDISSAFKNSFKKKIDIPIHKIFKDRIEYFTTDYIDTLTNAYTILFILTKYLRYLEKDDLKYNVIHSECTILFTIFEFIKENGISRQTSEDYYNLIVLYDDLDNMTIKNIKLDFLKKCDVKHPKDVLKIINGERTAEQRGMLSLNVNSTDKHKSNVFYKIRRRLSKLSFIKLSLLLCVFVGLGCAIAPQLQQLSLILLSAACVITAMTEPNEDLAKNSQSSNALSTKILDDSGNSTDSRDLAKSTASQSGDLAKDSSTNAEASYNAVSYVNIQLLLDKIERNIQKGYKFRNIDIVRYRNIYFKEIVNNCKAENLPETTIDGYAEVLNSLLDDMYNAELESAISESNAALATLQSLTQIDGIQKDSIQDFCVNGLQKTTESTDDSASDN
ncbi:hypothetical protein [Anaerobutyricum soehngenii]|uniref:hypothetical protein n=1 Tax=Anaerobutyricum soehngenii TaxID=105843 RepID=UPI0032BFE81B